LFVSDVKGADIEAHEKVVINNNDAYYIDELKKLTGKGFNIGNNEIEIDEMIDKKLDFILNQLNGKTKVKKKD